MALLTFSGVLLGTAYLAQRAGGQRQTAQVQLANLAWAEQAVHSFAAVHGRLPCPASSRAGFEDCSAGAKGWLPVRSLDTAAASGPVSTLDMRYLVYRGTGADAPPDPDLAALPAAPGEAYRPTLADGSAVKSYAVLRSGLDLCAKLRALLPPPTGAPRWLVGDALTGGPGNAARAHMPAPAPSPAGSAVVNLAYGVSVAGWGDGASGSGINADLSVPGLETPGRPHDAQYGDVVRAVDARALYEAMSCGIALASVDTLATAQVWSDDAAGYRDGNLAVGAMVHDILKFFLVADGIGVKMAAVDLGNGIFAAVANVTKLNASVVGLPITLPAVLTYIAGLGSALSGLALNAADFTASAAGLTIDAMYTAAYDDVSDDAADTQVWQGGPALLQAADSLGVHGGRGD